MFLTERRAPAGQSGSPRPRRGRQRPLAARHRAGKVVAILNVTWRHRIVDPGDRAVRVVGVIADEAGSSLHASRLRRELERSATTDPLTGSLNRRAWDAQLRLLMERARLSGAPLTVALVDDRSSLQRHARAHRRRRPADRVRRRRRDCLRDTMFARWGGEEFIVALYHCTPARGQILENPGQHAPGQHLLHRPHQLGRR